MAVTLWEDVNCCTSSWHVLWHYLASLGCLTAWVPQYMTHLVTMVHHAFRGASITERVLREKGGWNAIRSARRRASSLMSCYVSSGDDKALISALSRRKLMLERTFERLPYVPSGESRLSPSEAGRIGIYAGFDPTAPSLHIGNALVLQALRVAAQEAKCRVVAVVGDGTARIGDPAGRDSERRLLDGTVVDENAEKILEQIKRVLQRPLSPVSDGLSLLPSALDVPSLWALDLPDEWMHLTECRMHILDRAVECNGDVDGYVTTQFDPSDAPCIVRNKGWYENASVLDYLRTVGKCAPVAGMLKRDAVKTRLEKGLSFAEFSYALFQASDFVNLYRTHSVQVQIGGSDQWGNITAGIDLGRRILGVNDVVGTENGDSAVNVRPTGDLLGGITLPLLVDEVTGDKLGKSQGASLWLDADDTPPYQIYQHIIRKSDDFVTRLLPMLHACNMRNDKERKRLDMVMDQHHSRPEDFVGHRSLARDAVYMLHGVEAAYMSEIICTLLAFPLRTLREHLAGSATGLGFGRYTASSALVAAMRVAGGKCLVTMRQAMDGGRGLSMDIVQEALLKSGLCTSRGEVKRLVKSGSVSVNGRMLAEVLREGASAQWLPTCDADNTVAVIRIGKSKMCVINMEP